MVDERRDVVGHEPDVDRPVDVGGASVPLEVDDDDLVVPRQGGEDGLEHLARAEPPVKQDQRPPGPMALVVEVHAVDLGVCARALRLGCPVCGHRRPPWGHHWWVT